MVTYQGGRLPPGDFAVLDPSGTGRVTSWRVGHTGVAKQYPSGAPYLPRPRFKDNVERNLWFATTYAPWIRGVGDAIRADPEAAARRFAEIYPDGVPQPKPRVRKAAPKPANNPQRDADHQRRLREALKAAVMRRQGMELAELGEAMGLPVATVWRRAQAGEILLSAAGIIHPEVQGDPVLLLRAAARLSLNRGRFQRDAVTPGQ